MTNINAAMVKQLREKTGVGMMECKKALTAADGDLEKAIEALRKAGQAKAVKKGERIAAEGVIAMRIADDHKRAAIVEVNCETDFVARDELLKEFAQDVVQLILDQEIKSLSDLASEVLATNKTIEETRLELIAKLGENVSLRRLEYRQAEEGQVYSGYLHGGSSVARIGALVCLQGDNVVLAKDLSMHVAAMSPQYLNESQVPAEQLSSEKAILLEQVSKENQDKPQEILEKIIDGKLKKFVNEITMLGQQYIKDSGQTVAKLLETEKQQVISFVRYEVGEGIEKKVDNFVDEVMLQVRGA